jgi:ribosomal protein L40E
MTNRFLLSIGLAFLLFSITGLLLLNQLLHTPKHTLGKIPLSQPGVCGGGCGDSIPFLISESTLSYGLVVQYEWPKRMDINGSDSISIALTVPTAASPSGPPTPPPIGNVSDRGVNSYSPSSLSSEAERNCANQGVTDPRLCLIRNIFGKGYTMSTASAYMATTSFDIQLMGPLERSTNQPLIEWDWNIFPKSVGLQVITVGIDLQWASIGKGGGTTILRQFWETPITIEVDKPFLDVGQLSLSSAVSGIFGIVFTGVSLPWIWEQLRQKREQKKKHIRFCRQCGAENPKEFEFCIKCGKSQITPPDTTNSKPLLPLSSQLTENKPSSIGDTGVVQKMPARASSQEDGK